MQIISAAVANSRYNWRRTTKGSGLFRRDNTPTYTIGAQAARKLPSCSVMKHENIPLIPLSTSNFPTANTSNSTSSFYSCSPALSLIHLLPHIEKCQTPNVRPIRRINRNTLRGKTRAPIDCPDSLTTLKEFPDTAGRGNKKLTYFNTFEVAVVARNGEELGTIVGWCRRGQREEGDENREETNKTGGNHFDVRFLYDRRAVKSGP